MEKVLEYQVLCFYFTQSSESTAHTEYWLKERYTVHFAV